MDELQFRLYCVTVLRENTAKLPILDYKKQKRRKIFGKISFLLYICKLIGIEDKT